MRHIDCIEDRNRRALRGDLSVWMSFGLGLLCVALAFVQT